MRGVASPALPEPDSAGSRQSCMHEARNKQSGRPIRLLGSLKIVPKGMLSTS